jgi:hypothetical protein
MRDDQGRPLPSGAYLVRIIVDDSAQSRIVFKTA